jgi:hypothetical protein
MKIPNFYKVLIAALIVAVTVLTMQLVVAHAQSAKAGTFWGQGPSSTCDVSVSGGPAGLCVATDGIFTNAGNGALWVKFGGAGGVTSFNGQTGAVVWNPPAAPVTSVNGKTGAVTIAATTTLQ